MKREFGDGLIFPFLYEIMKQKSNGILKKKGKNESVPKFPFRKEVLKCTKYLQIYMYT